MINRGMGYVFQPTYIDKGVRKKAATWWISFSVRGRRIRENAKTTNRADATRLLKKRIGEVGIGRPVGPEVERTTVGEILDMVVADYKANERKSAGRADAGLEHLRRYFGKDAKARDVTSDRITAYQAKRREEKAKPATINYEVAMLRRAFRLALRAGRVPGCPEIQMLHVDNARKGFFEPDQFKAVVKHLPVYFQPVAAAGYIMGWRISELLSRQWRHVDLVKGLIRLEPGESKNGEGREFYFTPQLRDLFGAQREHTRSVERETGCIIPWVFHRNGNRIKIYRRCWKTACRKAGIPAGLVHDFRRTAVRNLERAGVSRSAAMRLTGHKTESIYKRYAIVDSTMLQEAAIKLAAQHGDEIGGVLSALNNSQSAQGETSGSDRANRQSRGKDSVEAAA